MKDSSNSAPGDPAPPAEAAVQAEHSPDATPTLYVHVIPGRIEDVGSGASTLPSWPAVDVIAVGHYAKVEPQFAELALDNAISNHWGPASTDVRPGTANIITDFTGRGLIEGELGVPFFLPDPRCDKRMIAIGGMGSVGRFGAPELTFLAWQLFWALARLGRKHLASVLIGSGAGNLEPETAVTSWVDGAARAMSGQSDLPPLRYLTFVEGVPEKAEKIRLALLNYQVSPGIPRIGISIMPRTAIPAPLAPEASGGLRVNRAPTPHQVTRICSERRGKKYLFGSLTDQASHRHDYTVLAPGIVSSANDDLAAQETGDHQRDAGKCLFNLLVPQSLRGEFALRHPLVIECDNRTAQLHWEMMVIPNLERNSLLDSSAFLGIYPTITRQFRNNFDVPPEPPPRFDHTLRVLIVADTDDKRPVPASREEAETISALFGKHHDRLCSSGSDRRVCVEALVGPEAASYDNVLKHLLQYPPYDVLHFSGHCEYVKEDPASSGWFFSKGKKITAYELTRVDCIPGFVFSNGCSTGETPPNISLLSRRTVPSFAEAFSLLRGVKNFVCTAWPVASYAARDFACTFYEEMLGDKSKPPRYMHEAMGDARKSIWGTPAGSRTWGAYQHYGNPWFRLS